MTDEIQAIAASDLNDANMMKWKKLLMVQLVLKNLLKFKISNLECKYGHIKSAFHTIKLKTTIGDPSQLATGYFKLEDTYVHLLDNVKHLEEKEKSLQLEKEALEEKYESLGSDFYEASGEGSKPDSSEI